MIAIVQHVFFEKGMRFVFSTRSKVPWILDADGNKFFEGNYKFVPGKDEVIVKGKAGYVVSFGEMLYRSLDAVLRCRDEGIDVGLINKPTLNIIDEEVGRWWFIPFDSVLENLPQVIKTIGSSPFVLIVESYNQKTGVSSSVVYGTEGDLISLQLGSKYGTWLLERGLTPKYAYMGTVKEGEWRSQTIVAFLLNFLLQAVVVSESKFRTKALALNASGYVQFWHRITDIFSHDSYRCQNQTIVFVSARNDRAFVRINNERLCNATMLMKYSGSKHVLIYGEAQACPLFASHDEEDSPQGIGFQPRTQGDRLFRA